MPTITFKAKVRHVFNMDNSIAYHDIKVPKITTRHCDMPAFRNHGKYGSFANSDMFSGIVTRALKNNGIGDYIRLDSIPECVTIDNSKFLAVVTITI